MPIAIGSQVKLGAHMSAVRQADSASGKTQVWQILARDGALLGCVAWFASWRQYNFDPEPDTTFNNQCLRDITAFLERLNREHKEAA